MTSFPKHALLSLVCTLAASVTGVAAEPALIGNQSCATSTCHGGVIGSGPAWHYSLSTWIASDPHAGAGLLLRDADSRRIVTRLAPAAGESVDAYDTVLRSRCISCHVTVSSEQTTATGRIDDVVLAAGVSCESCHGGAENWLAEHVRSDWQGEKRFAAETGMRDTESIIGRNETCARCHIGSRSDDGLVRDMNHDLIAAGHPALRFDLLLYNENLPKHWDVSSESESEFNASAIRVRKVGRAMNLSAAAALTSQRASAHLQDMNVPWPELADYDCFACHQSLSIREYLLPPVEGTKSPLHVSDGLPIWNAWHTINQVTLSRNSLEILSPQRSDAKLIAEQCEKLSSTYRSTAEIRMQETYDAGVEIDQTLTQLEASPPVDWHQAAIQYLEIDAALRDLMNDEASRPQAERMTELLRDAERLLRFEPDRMQGRRARYHSPTRFDPKAFRDAVLGALRPSAEPADAARSILIPLPRSVAVQP